MKMNVHGRQKKIQETVQAELDKTVTLMSKLQSGLQLWNTSVFTDKLDYMVDQGGRVETEVPR